MSTNSREYLCDALREHYIKNNVENIESFLVESSPSSKSSSRFIRLNPRFCQHETIELLTKELSGVIPLRVPWVNDRLSFFRVPGYFSLSRSPLFTCGRIYGMDISSGAAIEALLLQDDEIERNNNQRLHCGSFRVLDLCCAPGLKTCAIADILQQDPSDRMHEIVGVDVNPSRLHLCRNIIQKYHINPDTSGTSSKDSDNISISLFCADGTNFGTQQTQERISECIVFESNFAREQCLNAGKRKRMNKSAKSREKKMLKSLGQEMIIRKISPSKADSKEQNLDKTDSGDDIVIERFDRVLVDAECSTDGAVRHLQHQIGKKSSDFIQKGGLTNSKLTDSTKHDDLVNLQKKLIMAGYRLLKSGGVMIYSTCSLAREQNENVVSWLLDECAGACELLHVSFNDSTSVSTGQRKMILPGFDNIGIRFLPSTDEDSYFFGGGFYLAKLRKIMR